jgi:hypothetical protein
MEDTKRSHYSVARYTNGIAMTHDRLGTEYAFLP